VSTSLAGRAVRPDSRAVAMRSSRPTAGCSRTAAPSGARGCVFEPLPSPGSLSREQRLLAPAAAGGAARHAAWGLGAAAHRGAISCTLDASPGCICWLTNGQTAQDAVGSAAVDDVDRCIAEVPAAAAARARAGLLRACAGEARVMRASRAGRTLGEVSQMVE
jgi:hypothetical protein